MSDPPHTNALSYVARSFRRRKYHRTAAAISTIRITHQYCASPPSPTPAPAGVADPPVVEGAVGDVVARADVIVRKLDVRKSGMRGIEVS